jgi:hypothetical protein
MGHDRKVKKMESSIHLGIDSPMVIWHGDLDELTGDGGSGGTDPGGPTGESKVPTGSEAGPIHGYLAMCDATTHPEDLPGAQPGGSWVGGHHLRFEDALGDKAGHDDGAAYVVLHVGTVFIGPLTSP